LSPNYTVAAIFLKLTTQSFPQAVFDMNNRTVFCSEFFQLQDSVFSQISNYTGNIYQKH